MNGFDITEIMKKLDDSSVERIAFTYGTRDDVTKERIFSEIMRRMGCENEKVSEGEEVTGVEIYHRSRFSRFISVAATLVITVGLIGGGAYMFHRYTAGIVDTISTTEAELTTDYSSETDMTSSTEITDNLDAQFVSPDPDSLSYDEYYGKMVSDLAAREDYIRKIMLEADYEDFDIIGEEPYDEGWKHFETPYIQFASTANCKTYNYEKIVNLPPEEREYELIYDKVFYYPVYDDEFKCVDDIRDYINSVYTTDNDAKEWMNKHLCSDTDDINEGDLLCNDSIYFYIDYRGQLYKNLPVFGKTYLLPCLVKSKPVVVSKETDDSFKAYIPVMYGIESDVFDENDDWNECWEYEVVYDTKAGGWRIASISEYSYQIYKDLTEMISDDRSIRKNGLNSD